MKNKQYAVLALYISLLFLFSCKKEIPFSNEEQKPKIVVNSLFLADSVWQVQIGQSNSILEDKTSSALTNAQVNIYNSNHELLSKLSHQNKGNYIASNKAPLPNQQYKIEVSAPNFTSVSATEKVPNTVPILSIDTTTTYTDKLPTFAIDLSFKDPTAVSNFYYIEVSIKRKPSYYEAKSHQAATPDYLAAVRSNDFSVEKFDNDDYYDRNFIIFNDQKFNGQNYTLSFSVSNWNYKQYASTQIRFYSISEAFFNYKTSLERYQQSSGNPFAQATQVYSNIDGGIGIFAGASASTWDIVL